MSRQGSRSERGSRGSNANESQREDAPPQKDSIRSSQHSSKEGAARGSHFGTPQGTSRSSQEAEPLDGSRKSVTTSAKGALDAVGSWFCLR